MATEVKTEDLEKRLESMLDIEKFPPPDDFRKQALVQDESMYEEAAADLEGFWSRQADERELTYAELHRDVQRFANALKSRGIGKGDVVGISLPMIPEVVIAMLA